MNPICLLSPVYTTFVAFIFMATLSSPLLADEFDPSWSLDFSIEPKETHIAGNDLTNINGELTLISQVSCEHQALNAQQCQQVEDSGGQFDMLVDGNQDGRFERWQIAVAQLRNGNYAKVLLVHDDASGDLMQVLLVDSINPGFSALYFHQGQIMWGMCLSCDVLADVVWEAGAYQLKWQPSLNNTWPLEALAES